MTSGEKGAAAIAKKDALLSKLSPSGQCQKCGRRPKRGRRLEIHHPNGRAYVLNRMNRWQRVIVYLREHEAGVPLQAWCRRCNAQDGAATKQGCRSYANYFADQAVAA